MLIVQVPDSVSTVSFSH